MSNNNKKRGDFKMRHILSLFGDADRTRVKVYCFGLGEGEAKEITRLLRKLNFEFTLGGVQFGFLEGEKEGSYKEIFKDLEFLMEHGFVLA